MLKLHFVFVLCVCTQIVGIPSLGYKLEVAHWNCLSTQLWVTSVVPVAVAINVVVRRGGTTAGVTGAPAGPPEGVEATPTTTKDAYVDKD